MRSTRAEQVSIQALSPVSRVASSAHPVWDAATIKTIIKIEI
jgi:hypothetical protein